MQTVDFENEDCRLFCPMTGVAFETETGSIDSPALAFLAVDEAGAFSYLRDDFTKKWNLIEKLYESGDIDWEEAIKRFSKTIPGNIVCFNMRDGISGGCIRIAFDMHYEHDSR